MYEMLTDVLAETDHVLVMVIAGPDSFTEYRVSSPKVAQDIVDLVGRYR